MYAAELNNQRLLFEVAGVYRRNMIMRDRQTGTLWQHATGEALLGPLAGSQLRLLGGELVRWSKWQSMKPHTKLMVEPEPADGRYPGLVPRQRLNYMLNHFTTNYAAAGLVTDKRLPLHEEVIGVTVSGVDKAYPLSLIRAAELVHDQIDDDHLVIMYDADGDSIRGFICPAAVTRSQLKRDDGGLATTDGKMRWLVTGEPVTPDTPPLEKLWVERQWWLGWVEFHPASEIYNGQNTGGSR